MNKKVIIGIAIVAIVAVFITLGIKNATGSASTFGGGNSVTVKTEKITKGSISSYVSADGKVEEVDKAEIYFDSVLKVTNVMAEEGQKVTKGQKLFEVDLDALNSQLDQLKLNRATQQTSASSKALDAEVERSANALRSAERSLKDAKKTYEDNKALYASNAISKSELDMSEKALTEAESGVQNAKLAYNTAVENKKNTRSSTDDNLKVTDMQISDLEKRIGRIQTDCASPIDGVIASIGVEKGAFTSNMQSAYRIINPDKLQIRAKVKEYDIKEVAVGQEVKISGDAIDKEKQVTGTVKSISPVAVSNATSSGSETVIEVLVAVNGAGDVLKPGLNVTCDISTVNKKDAVLVPMEAITPDKDDNNMVFIVDEKTMTMVQKKVTVGLNSEMNVEILDGVKEGDLVVLDPQPSYRDGQRVKLAEKSE